MKLILNSNGLNTKKGFEQIYRTISQYDLLSRTIYIVSHPAYELDEKIMRSCLEMGFLLENIYFSKDGILNKKFDFVYITEGNTFEIMRYMRDNRLDTFVTSLCKNGAVYIGSSAGAIIASEDIMFAKDFDSNYSGIYDYSGLGLFDGIVLPHYNSEQLKWYIEEANQEYISHFNNIYCVDDDNVLCLDL